MFKELLQRYRALDAYDRNIVHLGLVLCVLVVALVVFECRAVVFARDWAVRERERVYTHQDSCNREGLVPFATPFYTTGGNDD